MADKPPTLQQRLQKLQGDGTATPATPEVSMGITKGAEPTSSDPVERAVNWGAENLVPEGTPDWLRTVGRYTIPQNTPEAVLALALSPIPGGLAAKSGVKALAGLGARSIPGFLGRTALTGGATAAAGAATGHDPVESGVMGAGGRVVGDAVGGALKAVVQSKIVKRMTGQMTSRLADSFRDIIGPWLPEGATDQAVIRDVLADEPSKRVGEAINTLRQKNAGTLVNIMDLEPALESGGVIHTWKGGATAGPGRVDPKTVKGGMVWPPAREFEKKLTPGGEVAPYGAVESSPRRIGPGTPGGEIVVPEKGMVPFGSIDAQIESRITDLRKMVSEGIAEREDHLALMNLEQARLNLAGQVKDPQMQNVLKEYARTKQLRDLLWGKTRAAANQGETVVEDLIDAKTGNLTTKGIIALQGRLIANAPRLQTLRPDEIAALQHAMNLDLALGGARAEAGRGLAALMPGFSHYGGGIMPHLHWGGKGPSAGSMPGWQGERSALDKILPDALKILLGTEVPAKIKENLK